MRFQLVVKMLATITSLQWVLLICAALLVGILTQAASFTWAAIGVLIMSGLITNLILRWKKGSQPFNVWMAVLLIMGVFVFIV